MEQFTPPQGTELKHSAEPRETSRRYFVRTSSHKAAEEPGTSLDTMQREVTSQVSVSWNQKAPSLNAWPSRPDDTEENPSPGQRSYRECRPTDSRDASRRRPWGPRATHCPSAQEATYSGTQFIFHRTTPARVPFLCKTERGTLNLLTSDILSSNSILQPILLHPVLFPSLISLILSAYFFTVLPF